jgi:hypothetical protein
LLSKWFNLYCRYSKVTPTVNAETGAQREKILKHFRQFTDLAADKGCLDHYFKRPTPQKSIAAPGVDDTGKKIRLLSNGGGGGGEGGGVGSDARDKGKDVIIIDDDEGGSGGGSGGGGGGGSGGGSGAGGSGGGEGGGDCGIDPEVLAALGGALSPAELRQQTALWEEAQRWGLYKLHPVYP